MRKLQLIVIVMGIMLLVVYASKTRKEDVAVQPPPPVQPDEVTPPKPREPTYEEALASISEQELKKHLEYLASQELEGRMSGKRGNVVAAQFIKKLYSDFGLETMYHKFNIERMNPGPNNETGDNFTQNIYAWIEGNDPVLKDEIVVIGAHMDHIGYGPKMSRWGGGKVHPGADDNASGTVALIQIAKAFSMLKGKNKRTVVFQSYSAEEMGLIGSRYYCNNPVFPKDNPNMSKHIFMLNMDMVGYLGQAKTLAFNSADSSLDIKAIIGELSGKYSFANSVTSRGSGGSDHASFYNKKVPIAFLHTGLHPHYHTPTDTADRINFAGVEKVAKYGFELSWKVVNSDSRPRFNWGDFRPMEYTHDHGHTEVKFPEENK